MIVVQTGSRSRRLYAWLPRTSIIHIRRRLCSGVIWSGVFGSRECIRETEVFYLETSPSLCYQIAPISFWSFASADVKCCAVSDPFAVVVCIRPTTFSDRMRKTNNCHQTNMVTQDRCCNLHLGRNQLSDAFIFAGHSC